MKKVLVIHANPLTDTFVDALSNSYISGAIGAKAEVREIILRDLNFDINFREGYRGVQILEPDLQLAQQHIQWADHLVFFYPNWWATFPALLKGFIDRTFLPGFAFQYQSNSAFPIPLLKGKTARLIVTMDSPSWYYHLVLKAPGHHAMRKGVLHFCGIKPVRISTLSKIRAATEKQRNNWLRKMYELGQKQK